ncbi:response regulator transcription factor [Leekyejoonella antrihumi]|uniref:Response regulator transcription factor n=1 Tax=Leekyejoonella antrihumi TaxID=1660198 RepID=A0A563DRX9_9MICO|nr:response regulator transcription factor [Leekyejoonella antrihumi]TWP33000.1 response regulator transcription factor [Leekyejoonella antrihumi]
MEQVDRPLRICGIDDHELVLVGIIGQLREESVDFEWLGSATTWPELEQLLALQSSPPDIVLVDLQYPDDTNPNEVIATLTSRGIRCVVLTSLLVPVPIQSALEAGAVGVMLKGDKPQVLVHTLTQLAQGEEFAASSDLAFALANDADLCVRLAPQEVNVLRQIADGLSQTETAHALNIKPSTVKTYLNRVFAEYRSNGRYVASAHGAIKEARADGYLNR